MGKFKEVKEAMKNTPPERLAKIEYQSHFIHMLGVTAVCGILIFKGFWWIIFAFVFSLGVSYSQCVSAYQKHNAIVNLVGVKKYNPKTDKSFTRPRDYLIKKQLGKYTWLWVAITSVIFVVDILPRNNWWQNIIVTFAILFIYIFLYFFVTYWFAKSLRDMK